MWLQLVVVVALLALVAQAHNEISRGKLSILNSEVKPGNLLPQFMFMMGSVEVTIYYFVYSLFIYCLCIVYVLFIHSLTNRVDQ